MSEAPPPIHVMSKWVHGPLFFYQWNPDAWRYEQVRVEWSPGWQAM